MIFVTGATGTIGSALLPRLIERDAEVRALAHSPSSRERIDGLGVDAVDGDFDDPDGLERVMVGCDHLFLLSPPDPAQAPREKAVIEAAVRAGVTHVVALSALGTSHQSPVTFLRWHADIDDYLVASDVGHTILRPAAFMNVHLLPVATVPTQGRWYGMTGDGPSAYIAADDVAEVAAVALTVPGHTGQIYELTGPRAITLAEAAAELADVLGRQITYVEVPADQFRATLESMGLPDLVVGGIVGLYTSIREGHQSTVTNWVERLTGRPPHTYRAFAEAHMEAFSGTGG